MKKKSDEIITGVILPAICVVAVAFIIVILAVSTMRLHDNFEELATLESNRRDSEQAILQLLDGSDYLTKQIYMYASTGEVTYMKNYCDEAFHKKNRDKAMERLFELDINKTDVNLAIDAKEYSDKLLEKELWAMKLITVSTDIKSVDIPEEIASYKFSDIEDKLSDDDKKKLATEFVFGMGYMNIKNKILKNITEFRFDLNESYGEVSMSVKDSAWKTVMVEAIICICLVFMILTILVVDRWLIKKKNAKLNNALHDARRDSLTNLYNKKTAFTIMGDLVRDNPDDAYALLMIDVDNFKKVNDRLGHLSGDNLLIDIAGKLRDTFRQSDIVARVGGDEFMVFIVNSKLKEIITDRAESVIKRIKDEDNTTLCIGIAFYNHLETLDELYSRADKALYEAKENGKNRVVTAK